MSATRRDRRQREHRERRALKNIVRRLRSGTASDTDLRMLAQSRWELQRLASTLPEVPPGVRVVAIAFEPHELAAPRLYLPLDMATDAFEREGNGTMARYLRDTPANELPAIIFGHGGDCQVLRLQRAIMSPGGQA